MRELRVSLAALEAVLARLDQLGAGIAAIHVDAAISQLKNNLEIVVEDDPRAGSDVASCQSECPPFLP